MPASALTPIGSIIMYAGNLGLPGAEAPLIAAGWIPCDGRMLPADMELNEVIGFAHGGDAGSTHFAVPDLRGVFLRGLDDEDLGHDPDVDGRTAPRTDLPQAGSAKRHAGSYQTDVNVGHYHDYAIWSGRTNGFYIGESMLDSNTRNADTSPWGDTENRPYNQSVYFLICYANEASTPQKDPSQGAPVFESFEIPVGAVVPSALAGDVSCADGTSWLVCEGRKLDGNDPAYAALYRVLGTTYGSPGGASYFIPDYRGRFLRGVNAGRDSKTGDPDAGDRVSPRDGAKGDAVGTTQDDSMQKHTHTVQVNRLASVAYGTAVGVPENPSGTRTTSENHTMQSGKETSGGLETRPVNMGVDFLIRAR